MVETHNAHLLAGSHAATPYVASKAEHGTLSGAAQSNTDATGNYFKAGCYTQSNVTTEGNYVD